MVMPKAYEGNEPYIFISYAHKDSAKIIPIIQALQNRGFRVWYDEGLEVGSSWSDMIEEYLYNCACTICFISSNFLNSQNCKDEIDYAKEISKGPLIVYLEDIQPDRKFQFRYGRLHALKYTDFSNLDLFMDKLDSTEAILPCRGKIPAAADKKQLQNEEATDQQIEKLIHEWAVLTGVQIVLGEKIDAQEMQRVISLARKTKSYGKGAEDFCQLGVKLFDTNDFASAVECFRVAADMGHVRATTYFGVCCYQGAGVNMDHKKAARLFQKAASQGDQEAQYFLGILYEEGHGVPQSLHDAIFWFQRAGKTEDIQRCQAKLHS